MLEALKHVAPMIKRVALIFNPDTAPFAPMFWQPVEDAAPSFDVEPIQTPVRDVSEMEGADDMEIELWAHPDDERRAGVVLHEILAGQ